jgi:chemotaxis regulatin CheY-phosphate phosphatase CheZ
VSPKQSLAEDYAALEATLRATPLGRWFLAEYARRNRTPETQLLLDAIGRLEATVLKPQRQTGFATVLAELVELSEAIARTRQEIAKIRPPHHFDTQLNTATEELDQIVGATETATSEILTAAEEIQEVAWTLREKGIVVEYCDKLDQRAVDIYTACSFQDITGQRTGKVVRALRFIEQRINAMIEIWGVNDIAETVSEATARMEQLTAENPALLNGPQPDGEGLKQDDVDEMLSQPPARASKPPEASAAPEGERFEKPEPLTLEELHAVKRAALFG